MTVDQLLSTRLLALKIIWVAMLVSLIINLCVGLSTATNFPPLVREDMFGMLRAIFYVLSFIIFIAIGYIRKLFLSKGQDDQSSQPPQRPTFQKYMIATVVSFAMSEAIGILGLFLFFMGKNPMDLYLLIGLSAVAMFLYRPKREAVIISSEDAKMD